jgi:hypothetical protein
MVPTKIWNWTCPRCKKTIALLNKRQLRFCILSHNLVHERDVRKDTPLQPAKKPARAPKRPKTP